MKKLIRFTDNKTPGTEKTIIHELDSRATVIVWTAYIMAVVSLPKYDLIGALVFLAIPVFIIVAFKIPLKALLRQIIWALPFILFMAIGNGFIDKRMAFSFNHLTITYGMISGIMIMVKAVLTLIAAVLLLQLIRFIDLIVALRQLKVPEVLTTQLTLLYRYIFLLGKEGYHLQKARALRTFKNRGKGLKITGSLLNTLMVRTTERSTRIYQAMLARGFHGTFPTMQKLQWSWKDSGFLVISIAGILFLRIYF